MTAEFYRFPFRSGQQETDIPKRHHRSDAAFRDGRRGHNGPTVSAVAGYFSGPVTLSLPLATTQLNPSGLAPGVQAHYSSVDATVPAVPGPEAALLAWGDILNQAGVLAALALVFLLALRLRPNVLFTSGSVWTVGTCGTVLALAGSARQVLDAIGRSRPVPHPAGRRVPVWPPPANSLPAR